MFTFYTIITSLILIISCKTQSPNSAPVGTENNVVVKPKLKRNFLEEIQQGNQYAKDGLLQEAIRSYAKVLKKNKGHLLAHRNIGIVYVKAGDYQKAIKHLTKSLNTFKEDFEANYYLAEALRAKRKMGKAIYRYNKSLEISPHDLETQLALSWSYYKIHAYKDALRVAYKARKKNRSNIQLTIITARILIKIGKYQKALRVISKSMPLAKKIEVPLLKSVEGDIWLAMKECDKAVLSFRHALKEQPLLAGSLLGLGKCLAKDVSKSEKALIYLHRAMRIKPQLTEGYYHIARLYEDSDKKLSHKYYKRFAMRAKSNPELNTRVSEVLVKLKEWDSNVEENN